MSETEAMSNTGIWLDLSHKEYGWICPKCGTVWAPWVARCNCMAITTGPNDQTSPVAMKEDGER
jgi:uncharacterized OB-fold protein